METACCSNESTDAGSPSGSGRDESEATCGREAGEMPIACASCASAAWTSRCALAMSNCCCNTTWRASSVSVIEARPAAAADAGRLLHCGCSFQRRLPCRNPSAARIEGEIRFLHSEYHALLLAVELQIGGKQGLGRAVEIRGAPTEVQQQPIQPQQRLEHTGANQERPHLVVIRQVGIAGHADGAERRQIGAFRNPEPGGRGACCLPRRTRLGVGLLRKIDQIRQVVDAPRLNRSGSRSATERKTRPAWPSRRECASPLPAPMILSRSAVRAHWDRSPASAGSLRKPPTNPPSPPVTPSVVRCGSTSTNAGPWIGQRLVRTSVSRIRSAKRDDRAPGD